MRKRILFFLIIIAAFFLPALTVQASSNDFTVQVDEISTPVPGQSFTVDVVISENPGLTALNVSLNYDSKVMTLQSASFADFLTDDSSVKCSRSGAALSVTSGAPITRNGVWITLTFKLSSDVTLGSYPIGISIGSSGIIGEGGDRLSPKMIAGGVKLDCFHAYSKKVTRPTCSSEGYTEYRCTECSITYISDYVARTAHSWRNLDSSEATCTRPATLTRECKVCGEVETVETAAMLGHSYREEVVEPTCEKQGYTLHQCERCDDNYQDQIVSVVDHQYTKTYTKASTCAETGYDLYACTFCGLSYQLIVPTLEHQWDVQIVKPSHTQSGWSLYTCNVCGLSMRGEFTDPIEYVFQYTVEVEPSCTETGIRFGVCTDGCGHTIREVIPTVEHLFGEWEQLRSATVYREGRWQAVCTECGYTIESTTPKLIADKAEESPSVFSTVFWTDVSARIVHDTKALIVIGAIVLLIFLLILISKIRRAIRRRRDTSLAELVNLASGIEEDPPTDASAPEDIGNAFCHDYADLGLPPPSVMGEVDLAFADEFADEEEKEVAEVE